MLPIKSKVHPVAMRFYSGFTLIEIMVVMVIAGLLAVIAYPSYQFAIRKAKRTEGQTTLMQLMQQQERYYSQNTTYIEFSYASIDVNEKKFKWFSADQASASAYEIRAQACANETIQNCVMLTAQPGTANVNASFVDPQCGSLTYTSTGIKSADAPDCW